MSLVSWSKMGDDEPMATTLSPTRRTDTLEIPANRSPQPGGVDPDFGRSPETAEPVPSPSPPPSSSWWSDLLHRPSSDFLSPSDAVLFVADPSNTVRSIQR